MPEERDRAESEEATEDYGYDLAHDVDLGQRESPGQDPELRATYVATETTDQDQDYSYDLAHDIPPMRRD